LERHPRGVNSSTDMNTEKRDVFLRRGKKNGEKGDVPV